MPHPVSHNPPSHNTYHVNDGPLQPHQTGILRPSRPDLPLDELRRRYQEDGYLFLKGLLHRTDILQARAAYFTHLAPSNILKPGTNAVEGIFNTSNHAAHFPGIGAGSTDENGRPGGADAARFVDLALAAHTQGWYKDVLCKNADLHGFVAKFTGWGGDMRTLRRTLLRNGTPGNRAIGVHYDQIFLRQGEDTSVTAWVPMGDISMQGGGLIYLERGHILGREIEYDFTAKAKAAGMTDEEARSAFNANMMHGGLLADGPAEFGRKHDRRWLLTEYEAGDVVLHTPYTIHASTINCDPDNIIRLGTDLRFVDSSRPWDMRWSNDYAFGDGV
ncbi:hypothetical protein EJ05DRAFT_495860 [Pseudovirgaria hyperparasitica]|uniref:Phytanoyl-CoA hydroxylase n=1 Tax=Pseudovirgaria hyperparasitica TaxID=470096 RepID=A0A6A6WLI9_9PEZI|nr:uncharacterized protein EJ05DRAFT_495860 [Pseudovirgaria hyperparasitica]KAF2763018.1 hypothetical protein EJ05DRAFT_495860 [Pseudovirgaria hyperparasitica]